jgi:hypothetical protein
LPIHLMNLQFSTKLISKTFPFLLPLAAQRRT